ncbi:DUF2341 domain-containing protein [uncultured Paraglaciecola sp.]|uniref:DUF2341 domain-containing protein n=1 Tax=uncultured Paraglaciecola sp. TaxID=1765024 RepID=UPI0026208BC8|nr:DUF2341 domain-containing protein [uncultured Paraglaciecola sp.]
MAFPTGWGRKQKITIKASEIDATLTNFPVAITLDHLNSEIVDAGSNSALNGGGDIRFSSDVDGTTQLACEVQRVVTNATAGTRRCIIWVKVPSVSSSSDTDIWIWYKKSGETQPAVSDPYGRNAVWSAYEAVLHLNDGGTTGPWVDSTGNGHNATLTTGVSVANTEVNHPFDDNWLDFTTAEALTLTSSTTLVNGGAMSIQAWINADVSSGTDGIFGNRHAGPDSNWIQLIASNRGMAKANGGEDVVDAGGGLTTGVNFLQTITHDDASMVFYNNGVATDTDNTIAVTTGITSVSSFRIGTYYNGSFSYDGRVGECRASKVKLSADWLAAEASNINTPATFATAGTPEGTISNNEPTGSVVITGSSVQGQTLTSTNTLADADGLGSFTYAWLRDDVVISGATNDTYLLTAFDVGTTIKSRISFTDGEGNNEVETSAGVGPIKGRVEATYQDCYFTLVTDHVQVAGVTTFQHIPLPARTVHVPAGFFDGGSSSAANAGGNIEVHKAYPFTDITRIPAKIIDFDINAGTIDFEYLHPSLSAIAAETLYIRKVNADQVQPAADEAYGSDLVDNAVTFPDDANLATTLANAANNDNFYTTGPLVCTLIGGVAPSQPSEYRFLQSVLSDPISSVMRAYDG